MKNKIIHYCWFGPKPIPKLAKKCIASWQKFMPDYEIKLWSEHNVDLKECDFIKEAGLWDKVKILNGSYYDNFIEIVNYVKDGVLR